MDVRTYLCTVSRQHARVVCKRAGTTYDYLTQLAKRPGEPSYRRPSLALARRLAEASDGAMTVRELRPDLAALLDEAAA
jgi:hypothetical protein